MTIDMNQAMPTVNGQCVTIGMMALPITEQVAQRYLQLIEELGDEMKRVRGWKSEVSRRLGVDQSYISRLIDRERVSIGIDAVEEAVRRLRIRRDFFYDAAKPRTYHDYEDGHSYEAWSDFVRTVSGKTMRPLERKTLESVRFYVGKPTVALYEAWLLTLRGMTQAASPAAVALNQGVDEELDENGITRV